MDGFLDPSPAWVTLGGPHHLAYVAGLVVVAALLLSGRGWVREHATLARSVVLVVLLMQQVALYGFYATIGWDWAESLPLHISRISALLCVVYLVTGSRRVMDVLFYFGLWAWASFSYPQNVQPVDHILGWSFWINHVVTLLMPAFAWITTGWRPTVPALWRSYAWFLLYVLVAVAANALTGGNYFYQRDKPVAPWLPDVLYLVGSLLATLAIFWIGYAVSRLIARRTGETEPQDRPGVASGRA